MKFKILTGSLRHQKRSDDEQGHTPSRIPTARSIVIANHEVVRAANRVGGGALAWLYLGIR